jgi:hypothetical protein
MSEQLAKLFHETYERLAPTFGYETRKGSAVPWDQVPARNKRLMIAVANVVELEFFSNAEDADGRLRGEFWAETVFGHHTRQPFVELSYNGRKLAQMPPEDAVSLAMNLLQVASASLTDAFLFSFLEQHVKVEPHEAAGVMAEFREWRDKRAQGAPEEQKP